MLIKNQKKLLLLALCTILVTGFLATSLLSFFVSISYLRDQIASSSLPLTSDNIYSEIQRDIIKPIYISSAMAHNSFLRDWALGGETDLETIRVFLSEIKESYGALTSFYVSEETRNYYYPDGILKQVSANETRDAWYFRVREMEADYELNVDPDMANKDAMTIFINHRAYDYEGRYIGATGIGLAMHSALDIVRRYQDQFDSAVYFISPEGEIVLRSDQNAEKEYTLYNDPVLSDIASEVLASKERPLSCNIEGERLFVNSRFIPELNWFLLVTQGESETVAHTYKTLIINLALCALIILVVIVLTALVINAYQKVLRLQQEELLENHQQLEAEKAALSTALKDVKQLTGLLPICASCKKIRDDQGYWQQIEKYVQEHSDANFTHGICPECQERLYPDVDIS